MTERFFKKALQGLALFFGITWICFGVIHLAPGEPNAGSEMNPLVSLEAREKLTLLYGLDRPVFVQYMDWLMRVVTFDFGESLVDGEKVHKKILTALPVTLGVNGLSLALAFFFGIPVGVWMAQHRGSKRERTVSAILLAVYSLPGFWLALLLVSVFSVSLQLFPISGLHSLFYEERPWWWQGMDMLRHVALPVIVIAAAGMAVISRYVKAAMEEVLSQNFIRAARARGIPEQKVLRHHALRNAMLPVITLVGLSIPALLGGSVILESVFAIPGMGRLFFNSVFQRDYPVIMGVLTLGAALTLLGNAFADIAYTFADPRIRQEESSK